MIFDESQQISAYCELPELEQPLYTPSRPFRNNVEKKDNIYQNLFASNASVLARA